MDRSEICCGTHGDGKPDVPCLHSPTGLIRDRYRRLDSGSALAEVHMVADSSIGRVVRFDADDPLSKAARDAASGSFCSACGRTKSAKSALRSSTARWRSVNGSNNSTPPV